MSENVEAPPSAPSTHDIAAQVVDSFDTPTETGETTAAEPTTETAAPAETPPPAVIEPELSAAAKFLLKQGHQAKKVDGRPVWLPYQTVEKMLDRYVSEHRGTWDGEKTTLSQERDRLKADLDEMYADLRGEPKAFLQKLAQVLPGYAAFLEPPKAEPQAPPPALPDPDAEWNGAKTWSMEAFQKSVIPYIVQQAKAEARAEAEHLLKPLKEREEKDKATQGIRARTQKTLAEAETWPLFGKMASDGTLSPFQQEVLDALKADASLDLRGAYMKVAIPRLTEDDTKKRERLMKEISETAKSTPTVPRTPDGTPKVARALTTQEITRRVLDRMERSGA